MCALEITMYWRLFVWFFFSETNRDVLADILGTKIRKGKSQLIKLMKASHGFHEFHFIPFNPLNPPPGNSTQLLKSAIETVSFPMNNGDVSLPEGTNGDWVDNDYDSYILNRYTFWVDDYLPEGKSHPMKYGPGKSEGSTSPCPPAKSTLSVRWTWVLWWGS